MYNEPPVFPGRIDPGDRFRERRRLARRRRRIRRLGTVAVLCGGIVALALNARFISGGEDEHGSEPAVTTAVESPATTAAEGHSLAARPAEIRGVHVTMALASSDTTLESYLSMTDDGLTAIEVDVKDERGDIAFVSAATPLALEIGAAKAYYDPQALADRVHAAGLYLIGRVVVFEDTNLAEARPGMAVQTSGKGLWRTANGDAWTNPYDKRVWDHNLAVAEAAARAGFDEIMFDYVRFPSNDGDVTTVVYPSTVDEPKWRTIERFLEYASQRLRPLEVRVSAALFGLAATQDLGIGQRPRVLAKHLDTIYPMVYPSLFGPGQYNIPDPSAQPGRTVSYALLDYGNSLLERSTKLVPWLQDYSYSLAEVEQQISASRRAQATVGFMLWNAEGEYTTDALAPR